MASAPVQADVACVRNHLREGGLEAPVDLHRVHRAGRAREGGGQHPQAGAHLQHGVARADARLAHGQVDQVLVEQEVLAELGVGAQAMGREQPHDADPAPPGRPGHQAKARAAFRVVSSSRASSVTPRSAAMNRSVWTTLAGRLGRPRRGTGAR